MRKIPLMALLLFGGCTNNYLTPDTRQMVTDGPAEPWDPACEEWYCPRDPNYIDYDKEMPLDQLLDLALSNHPLTRQAWATARAQAYAVGAAESAYWPTIDGNVSLIWDEFEGGNVTDQGNSSVGTPITRWLEDLQSQVSVSYLILDFGGRSATVRATLYALDALNWTQNRTVQQVLLAVLQWYYSYINARENAKARAEDLKNAQENLDSAQALYNAGIARKLDLLQAKSSRENAYLALVTAKNQIGIALGSLTTALGISPDTGLNIADIPDHFPVDGIHLNLDELMETAKTNRPDLAAAYAGILQAEMNYKSAVSASLPTLSTTSNFEWSKFLTNAGIDGHEYTAALSLDFPIFSGFLYQNQIRQASETVRAVKANFDNLESLALLDVVTGYYNFLTAQESMVYSDKYLEFSQEAYDLSLSMYKNGTGSMLDLLAAQATLADARSQKINNRTGWAISLFNIAFATGTLDMNFVKEELHDKNNLDIEFDTCECLE